MLPALAGGVRSLVWAGDDLLDPAAGWVRYGLDGTSSGPRINYSYPFDAALRSPSGEYTVLYTRLGTKGLLLKGDQPLRELNRSYVYAHRYEYPVALFRLPDGREVIAHCPEDRATLHLDELESGRRLTGRSTAPRDVFHSRLRASADGQSLLSAGWLWHPLEAVSVYDVRQALADPGTLDTGGAYSHSFYGFEVQGAGFAPDGTVLLATSAPLDDLDEDYLEFTGGLEPGRLARYSLREGRLLSQAPVVGPLGNLMGLDGFAVGFHDHPRLVDLESGAVVGSWPDLPCGEQAGSIIRGGTPPPPIALDPANRRFAVAGPGHVTVVVLG